MGGKIGGIGDKTEDNFIIELDENKTHNVGPVMRVTNNGVWRIGHRKGK